MIITPLDVDFGLARYDLSRGTLPRSATSDVHLTAVRDYIYDRLGLGKKYDAKGLEGWELAGASGFLLEDALSKALADSAEAGGYGGVDLVRGVELTLDGITGSPDGLDPQTMEPWDFKCTWRSITGSPPAETWKWMVQVKGYARMAGVRSAVIVALYLCGDFRPPKPRLVSTRFEFTDQELDENWLMLRNALGPYQESLGRR